MKGDPDAPSAPAYSIPQDEETGCIRGSSDGGRSSGEASTSGQSSGHHSPSQDFRLAAVRPGHDQGDEGLYKDLLRKAHGDEQLAKRWLSAICGHGNEGTSDLIAAARVVSFSKGDLDTAALEAGAPEAFFCPISFKMFRDPVMLSTGQTYERRYIERWLAGGSSTCPATGTVLAAPVALTPNVALRKSIEVWAEKHATWLLGAGGKVKPIPEEEDFARPRRGGGSDADLALAIRLQEEEMLTEHGRNAAVRADRRQRRRRCSLLAALLYCLTAGQVATFVLALWQNDWQIEALAQNPLVGPSEAALRALGSLSTSDIVDRRQYWRLITSIFLCSGIIELVLAVMTLWAFGVHVSRALRFSAVSVAALYILPGIVGALVSVNLSTDVPSVGAPAAVCGLIGAALADQIVGSKAYRNHACTLIMLAVAIAQFTITGLLPLSSDLFFIVGSMVAGALVMCLLPSVEAVQRPLIWRPFQAVCALCLSAIIATCIVSCVNTKWWTCTTDASRAASSCAFAPLSNGTARIDCVSGVTQVVSTPYTSAPQGSKLGEICRSVCMQGHSASAGPSQSPPPAQASLLI
ncbi:U-box-domain-containing protein [Coccomyxa subellipsoidea C-169]|uniref:RHOMBOID-like protein n=1 Tax=Coccomyxa subellipsoidea (strain C-169) TaxID=574566 RepID=I0Z1A7_COCSC|nr:U-box-domain-containing protein [Coccomyxa subellipsoidea C-169]EIE24426.1 U-box-domain-containing protein [Coccomyxa subellipsoidea C-169]|eukprot:XP_005648970.1 U-box-domain-containing protein [Coccomyxa subellipsoidea C-169]